MLDKSILNIFAQSLITAGDYVRDFRKSSKLSISYKNDKSPLTDADIESQNIIINMLLANNISIPIISEECTDNILLNNEYFILLDPIDGTQSYINNENDYAINLAVIKGNRPVIGMIYLPEEDKLFYASHKNGAFMCNRNLLNNAQQINVNKNYSNGITVTISKNSNMDMEKSKDKLIHKIDKVIYMASAKKFTMIASGLADFYPRLGQTGEWDTASGDLLVNEAGGIMRDMQNQNFIYGKNGFMNGGFLVKSDNFYRW